MRGRAACIAVGVDTLVAGGGTRAGGGGTDGVKGVGLGVWGGVDGTGSGGVLKITEGSTGGGPAVVGGEGGGPSGGGLSRVGVGGGLAGDTGGGLDTTVTGAVGLGGGWVLDAAEMRSCINSGIWIRQQCCIDSFLQVHNTSAGLRKKLFYVLSSPLMNIECCLARQPLIANKANASNMCDDFPGLPQVLRQLK